MTPERWRRMCALFQEAKDRSPSGAEAYLREQCEGDSEMLGTLREMLQERETTAILQPPGPIGREPAFAAGQIVGDRYRIVRYLSRGGMGEVYEAEHPLLPDRVALKTLLPEIASDEGMVSRFKQEIYLARKIAHPNVCKLFDLEWHKPPGQAPVLFLTMELLRGETLAEHLRRIPRLRASDAFPLLHQMTEALHAAHDAGVIHRDFKPSNVMLTPSGDSMRVVVTDFGLARRASGASAVTATITRELVGTLDYMAPELLAGEPASFRSDIYALGMVAYEMVTGALPFAGETPIAAAFLRARQAAPAPRTRVADLEPRWNDAILRALDPDPARRFQEVRQFPRALRGESVSVTLALPALTRRRAFAATGAAAVLAAAGIGWSVWDRRRGRPSPEAQRLYSEGVDDIHAGAYFAATKALGQAVRLSPGFSLARARLAESWLELDLPERAAREFLQVRREDTSMLSQPDQRYLEAVDLTITREFAAAVAKYEEMRKLAGGAASDLDIDLGRAYEKAGKPVDAIAAYQRAAQGVNRSAAAFLRLAVLYSKRNQFAESEAAFAEAGQRYQQISNLEGNTELTLQRGVAANRQHKYDEAAAFLRKGIEYAHDSGNVQQEIGGKLTLANIYYAVGDSDQAQSLAREALTTAEANQMGELTVRGLVNLGDAYLAKRDYRNAEQYLNDGFSLARRTGSSRLAALAELHLASYHERLQKADDQIREATEALAYFEPIRWVNERFQALLLIARGHQYQSQFAEARNGFQQLLDEASGASDRNRVADAQEGLGNVSAAEENYPEALLHYNEFRNINSDQTKAGYALLDCAITLARLGRLAEAQPLFAQADPVVAKYKALEPTLARYRVETALIRNDYAGAIAGVRRATVELPNLSPTTTADLDVALALALVRSGDRQAGLKKCQAALAEAQKLENPGQLMEARMAQMEALLATGDRTGAASVFHDLEPVLEAHPESRWRALALLARSDRQYAGRAADALRQLETLWGHDALAIYEKRPDTQRLL